MKNTICAFALAAMLASTGFVQGQAAPAKDKSKRPSPPASATCKFSNGKGVNVDYSRPSMKGRKIFGGLVPFDKEWRTGANEATTFVTDTNVTVGGTAVAAGSYTLFTLPSQQAWKLIVSKKTGEWGVPYPGAASDLARIDMQKSSTAAPVEQLQISFKQSADTCTLLIEWENTRASVDIKEAR